MLKIARYVLLTIATIFVIAAVAIPKWSVNDTIEYGPYRYCVEFGNTKNCGNTLDDIGDADDKEYGDAIRATAGFGVLAVLVTVIALVFIIFADLGKITKNTFVKAIPALLVLFSALCAFLSAMAWLKPHDEIQKTSASDTKLNAGFALMILAAIIYAICVPLVVKTAADARHGIGSKF